MKYKIFFVIICFVFFIGISNINYASDKREGIDSFPDSYKPYLLELQRKHPNWKFIALYTNLDWNYVIENENKFGVNLVPKSYSDRWKNTKNGEYNVEVDAGWVDSSKRAVEYAMDPRNFLNEVRILQFEGLSYDESTNNIEGIEKILYGTEFYNRIVQYVNSSGDVITMSNRYSDLILSAGRNSQVNSYHLASRIKQEVGPFLSHSSISGIVRGYEGLYNFYNIGATSSSEPMGAIKKGLQYARDGNGASQATKDKYLIPWNNKERAITGGGIFIGSSYIHLGQDTIYLQKFHVSDNRGGTLFWHQYMTNVLAPYSESRSIYNGYNNSGMLNNTLSFIIPVYDNMLDTPVENPNILESDFTVDNTAVRANVSNTLNIRTGPSTSYETLTSVGNTVKMKRIARGIQSGELWDKVKLPNGLVGYAFHNYLAEVQSVNIEQINVSIHNSVINKGETKKLTVEILPPEAKDNKVEYSSSDNRVTTVDSEGNILGIKSGNATITVKAKDGNVFGKVDIQVYSPVTDMQLNTESLMLQIGDSFIVNPTIFPEDANNQNIIYNSNNQDVAKVNSDGKITAVNEGSTKIVVKTEEGNITREIQITVVPIVEEGEISFDTSLTIQQNEITGWDITKMNVSSIKEKINTIYNIEVYNANGKKIEDNELAGTGSKIRIIDENGIRMEYYIIIYGDVNGDGRINSVDLLVLQRHILEIEKLKGVFLKAGNINKNGKNPSSLDLLLIQRHILGLKIIEQ